MKIFIAASWLKLGGGVTRTLLELFKHIDYNKYDVTLMLMELDKDVLSYVPKEVRVIESNDKFQTASSVEILKSSLKSGKFLTALSYAAEQIDWKLNGDNYRHQQWITKHMQKQEEEYDIAISYAMMNSIVNKYVIDNVKAKKKILWCHIDMSIYSEKYIKGLEKLYPEYDRINCVSEYALNSVKEKYPELADKLRIAYNFIDSDRIIREAAVKPDIDVPTDKIKLCTVGRISEQKGIDILVDTAKALADNGVDFVWWVVGTRYNDEYNKLVESRIAEKNLSDKVVLLGEKNPPYPFMQACDIYVQPSRYEGYCTTTNEARILCKPIVTTRVAGADEQFVDGVNGSITDISADAIYEDVSELINSEDKRKMYSEELRNKLSVMQENSFESMIL